MKKPIFWTLLCLGIVGVAVFSWKNIKGVGPALRAPFAEIAELIPSAESDNGDNAVSENQTDFPLKLPDGFTITVFAKDLPLARVMLFDSIGNMWLSRTRAGAITMLEIDEGRVVSQDDIFINLRNPHGLAFDPENPLTLYYAEENRISRIPLFTDTPPEKIADLPFGKGHSTRTLLFGTDGRLYVSIGSSCNVCVETDSRRAKVFSLSKDGSNFREFASGLRNSVFMAGHPKTGEIWATEMGRDYLGDNLPPEEVNILKNGNNYGWPYCFDNNTHDVNFDPAGKAACEGKTPPKIEIQAHSAPLGLAFIPEDSNWPDEYKNNLLVAYHGSWNRSAATGYKVVRFPLDGEGNILSEQKDFITGWLEGGSGREAGNSAFGRPADIIFRDNAMYVSDDKAGVIYKIVYTGK